MERGILPYGKTFKFNLDSGAKHYTASLAENDITVLLKPLFPKLALKPGMQTTVGAPPFGAISRPAGRSCDICF